MQNVKEKKERHIVTWTQREDDILREQISIHGTENWTIIASKFKDKTTRQCRRRWYTYLNSDFKTGGWSPEEDMLLCEAQKIFGNRWTEIAKVVSGRTDNAVKNRFSTLCKKRAKHEAFAKENIIQYPNNKRIMLQNGNNIINGTSETEPPIKRLRTQNTTNVNHLRTPFSVLEQNLCKVDNSTLQPLVNNAQDTKTQGTFLKKDDPKINILTQQAELLSSLALKVDTENIDQSFENAWKALQDYLNQSKESNISKCKLQLNGLRDMVKDVHSSKDGQKCRQPDIFEESPYSSENSIGSTRQTWAIGNTLHQEILSSCGDEQSNNEFNSPLQVTPLFRSLAAGIPSPKFSESERRFLLKTLGMESSSPNLNINPWHSPPCKKSLFRIL